MLPTIIATRKTLDDYRIAGWSDGDVTSGMGGHISKRLPLDAVWTVLGEVCLYNYAEVRELCETARRLAKRGILSIPALRREANRGQWDGVDRGIDPGIIERAKTEIVHNRNPWKRV